LGSGLVLGTGNEPSAEEILTRAARLFQGLNDYSVVLTLSVQSEEVRVPETKIRAYYKRPDKFKLESLDRSFVLIPRVGDQQTMFALGDVLGRLKMHSDYSLLRTEEWGGRRHYVLQFVPRNPDRERPRVLAWLDAERYTLTRLQFNPRRGSGEVTVTVGYGRVAQRFWLPTRVEVRMSGFAPARPRGPGKKSSPPPEVRLSLTFRDYRVNQGLPDRLFAETEE